MMVGSRKPPAVIVGYCIRPRTCTATRALDPRVGWITEHIQHPTVGRSAAAWLEESQPTLTNNIQVNPVHYPETHMSELLGHLHIYF